MKNPKNFLTLFSHFLAMVFAISTFSPSQELINVTSPTPPAGYQVLLRFDESLPLNPLGVYINAIELMYKLAQEEWNDYIHEDLYMSVTTYNIWIIAASTPQHELQISLLVIGLQDSIIAMARLSGFFRLTVNLSLNGLVIGHLDFGRIETPPYNVTSTGYTKEVLLSINKIQSNGSLSNSGQIVDPYDSKFVVSYTFYGKAINSKEVFTAVLDGLAISAQYKSEEHCSLLEAVSVSGTSAISVSQIPSFPTRLHYSDVTKALLILTTGVIVTRRRFGEVEFEISYDGIQIAEGYILKLALSNNSVGGIAASR